MFSTIMTNITVKKHKTLIQKIYIVSNNLLTLLNNNKHICIYLMYILQFYLNHQHINIHLKCLLHFLYRGPFGLPYIEPRTNLG